MIEPVTKDIVSPRYLTEMISATPAYAVISQIPAPIPANTIPKMAAVKFLAVENQDAAQNECSGSRDHCQSTFIEIRKVANEW